MLHELERDRLDQDPLVKLSNEPSLNEPREPAPIKRAEVAVQAKHDLCVWSAISIWLRRQLVFFERRHVFVLLASMPSIISILSAAWAVCGNPVSASFGSPWSARPQ